MNTKRIFHCFLAVAAAGGLTAGQLALAQSYNWTTIAGLGGIHGYSDGAGSTARFNTPFGIAVDSAGNLLVTDTGNNLIRKLTSDGTNWTATTILGGTLNQNSAPIDGSGTSASFYAPLGLAANGVGQFFEVEDGNDAVTSSYLREITLSGGVWSVTTIPFPQNISKHLSGGLVSGAAVDASGDVVVDVNDQNQIILAGAQGVNWAESTIAGQYSAGTNDGVGSAARFNAPQGVCVDAVGNIYIADSGNDTIREIAQDPYTAAWTTTTIAGQAGGAGLLDGTNKAALFDSPDGLAVDAAGNIYVADGNNNAIRKMTPQGTNWVVTTIGGQLNRGHGTADGVGTAASFYHPAGLTVDGSGRVFVADYANNTIRMGVPVVITPPALQMATGGGAGLVIWPSSATGYVLQMTTNLNSGPWQNVTTGITMNYVFSGPMTNSQMFYRLQQQ